MAYCRVVVLGLRDVLLLKDKTWISERGNYFEE